jgi:hypothetical protein
MIIKNIESLKIDLTKVAFWGILVQIIATQGILSFYVFNLIGLWEVKKFLHSLGISMVLMPYVILLINKEKTKVSFETFLLFSYMLVQYLFLFLKGEFSLISFSYSFREVMLLMLLLEVYRIFKFTTYQFEIIAKVVLGLAFLNVIFVMLNFYLGTETYMKFLTGRFYWGQDPLLKFKTSAFLGFGLRSPGLIGESAALGYFGAFSFLIVSKSKLKIFSWIPLTLVLLSLTRSAYIIIVVYFLFVIFSKKKNIKLALYFSPLLVIFVIGMFKLGLFDVVSLIMRLSLWCSKVNLDSSFLFGGNLNNVGSAAPQGAGFLAILDSYWLLLYHGLGALGIVLVLYYFLKRIWYLKSNMFFLIGLIIAGLFVTFTQSIVFLVFFPLLGVHNWWGNNSTHDG